MTDAPKNEPLKPKVKKCTQCGVVQHLDNFYEKKSKGKEYLMSECKDCFKQRVADKGYKR